MWETKTEQWRRKSKTEGVIIIQTQSSKMCLSAKPYNSNFWRTNTSKYILRPRLPKYILQLIHAEDQHRDQEYKQQIDPEREIDRKPNDLTDSDSQPAWFGLNLQPPKGG